MVSDEVLEDSEVIEIGDDGEELSEGGVSGYSRGDAGSLTPWPFPLEGGGVMYIRVV